MLSFVRTVALLIISTFVMAGTSLAQDTKSPDAFDISDIAGQWRIEVIDQPNSTFKGSATIPNGGGKSIMAETITEDKCCGGKNHARVLQDSQITITDGHIEVSSKIVKFLLREEELSIRYSPDDFSLRRQDRNTLIGTANGYTPVRWIRDELEIS
ncbi:MAG: hypothetical protein ABJN69_09130 [Hellea sp.]